LLKGKEVVAEMLGFYLAFFETQEEKTEFENIYYKYRQDMYKIAFNILRNEHDAEDAVHEAFLSLARNMDKISGRKCIQIRNYLIIIVRNSSYRIYNKRKKEICADEIDENIPDLQNVEIDIEEKAEQQKLMELIKTLDEKYADVLILKYFYDLPDKEIARSLGISLENAKIRLHRGKAMLKSKLAEVKSYDGQTV